MLIFTGVRRFYDNIEMMYGWRINPYMAIGWTVTSPIFCMVCAFLILLRQHHTATLKFSIYLPSNAL